MELRRRPHRPVSHTATATPTAPSRSSESSPGAWHAATTMAMTGPICSLWAGSGRGAFRTRHRYKRGRSSRGLARRRHFDSAERGGGPADFDREHGDGCQKTGSLSTSRDSPVRTPSRIPPAHMFASAFRPAPPRLRRSTSSTSPGGVSARSGRLAMARPPSSSGTG